MRRGLAVRLILSLVFGPLAAGIAAQSQPQFIEAPAAAQAVVPALPATNTATTAAPSSPFRASAPFDPRYESSSRHQHGILDDPASLALLPGHILRDQRRLWLAPLRIRSQHAPWLAATAGITAGLFAVDARVQHRLTYEEPGAGYAFASNFGRFSGGQMDLLVAGGFYVAGRLGNSVRTQETGVLGLRAVIDVMILNKSMKMITQRRRPALDDGTPNHGATGEFFQSGRSFPSGHAAEAWALATIVAHQYSHRKWCRHWPMAWRDWSPPRVFRRASIFRRMCLWAACSDSQRGGRCGAQRTRSAASRTAFRFCPMPHRAAASA